MTRSQTLLKKCAEDLLDCRAPLSHEFLVENNVTADECFSLSETMGHIIKGYLNSPKEVQNTVILIGVTDGIIPPDIMYESVRKESLVQQLHRLNNPPTKR